MTDRLRQLRHFFTPYEKMGSISESPVVDRIDTEPYAVEEHALGEASRLKVICIGAGFTGLDVAYKFEKHLQNVDLQIYEKNEKIGGTWFENK